MLQLGNRLESHQILQRESRLGRDGQGLHIHLGEVLRGGEGDRNRVHLHDEEVVVGGRLQVAVADHWAVEEGEGLNHRDRPMAEGHHDEVDW